MAHELYEQGFCWFLQAASLFLRWWIRQEENSEQSRHHVQVFITVCLQYLGPSRQYSSTLSTHLLNFV
jgi:hypothetical protein